MSLLSGWLGRDAVSARLGSLCVWGLGLDEVSVLLGDLSSRRAFRFSVSGSRRRSRFPPGVLSVESRFSMDLGQGSGLSLVGSRCLWVSP